MEIDYTDPLNDSTFDIYEKRSYFYTDSSGIFKRKGEEKGGDDLGRTARAYIAWKRPEHYQAILKCFLWKEDKIIKIYRSVDLDKNGNLMVGYDADSQVRDHILFAIIAMKFHGHNDDAKRHAKALLKMSKISNNKHGGYWTWDSKSWLKAIANDRKYPFMFYFFQIILMVPSVFINRRLIGHNHIKQFYKRPNRFYHAFAQDISIWQQFVLPDSWVKRVANRIVLSTVEFKNIVNRILLGDKRITHMEILFTDPRRSYCWQTWASDSYTYRELGIRFTRKNLLDLDTLRRLIDKTSYVPIDKK